jgi:ABC-type uncharacterized transport system substrate-binding protein
VLPHPIVFRHRTRLVALTAERQLPTIWGPWKECVDAGGLMAYGPSLRAQFRRAAYFVDKILKGATPADLPVAYSTPKLPPIPGESCHRFHAKAATCSTRKLPLIP